MAATNRIAAYASGLVENGAEVDVISIHPINPAFKGAPDKREPDAGVYRGINYYHPSGRYRNPSRILRFLAMKSGWRFLSGALKVDQLFKQNKYDIAILSFDEPHLLFAFSKIAHRHKAKTVFIFDEYPIPIRHKLKPDIPSWKKKAYRVVLKNIDGYISISNELANYYNSYVKKPTLILPVIVNSNKFVPSERSKNNWITYIGNMEATKDNVALIAEAFSRIASGYPAFSLHFFGPDNGLSASKIREIAKTNNLTDRIILEGSINSELVPDIIDISKVMVSSQPDTLRAKGGFPTKLGEYVIMGVPTLLSDVGENSNYITDKDCFFAKPGNITDYAEKLSTILTNYKKATEIAQHGRQSVLSKYTQRAAGDKINNFILNCL